MTSTTMVAGPAMTRGGRLRQLRGAVRRAQAASDAQQRRWLETGLELVRLDRTLRRVQASLADPLLRNWCCCADPPVLTGLAGWRDAGRPRPTWTVTARFSGFPARKPLICLGRVAEAI